MQAVAEEGQFYDNVTFKIDTPEGKASIIIVEAEPGTIINIFFTIGKAGTGVNAWAFALAEMVTDSLKIHDLNYVIQKLSNISSSRWVSNVGGIPCRSGPEALCLALMRYKALYKDVPDKHVSYDTEFKPSRMKN